MKRKVNPSQFINDAANCLTWEMHLYMISVYCWYLTTTTNRHDTRSSGYVPGMSGMQNQIEWAMEWLERQQSREGIRKMVLNTSQRSPDCSFQAKW